MAEKKSTKVDLSRLDAGERARIEKILHPRTRSLSLMFRKESVETWRKAASSSDKSLTDWIEDTCNAAVKR